MKYNKILMIDDSADDANLVKRSVRSVDDQVAVEWIGDAEEALLFLEAYTGESVDVVLLDIKMPKMTGLEILEHLNENDRLLELPSIVVFSSSDLTIDKDRVKLYQGVDYQKKPEGYLEMKNFVRKLLARETV